MQGWNLTLKKKRSEYAFYRLTFQIAGDISPLTSCGCIRSCAESSDWWVNNLEWECQCIFPQSQSVEFDSADLFCPALVFMGECGKTSVSQHASDAHMDSHTLDWWVSYKCTITLNLSPLSGHAFSPCFHFSLALHIFWFRYPFLYVPTSVSIFAHELSTFL